MEGLRDSGVITEEEFSKVIEKSNYKDLTQALFRILSTFRLVICSEKQTKSSNNKNGQDKNRKG